MLIWPQEVGAGRFDGASLWGHPPRVTIYEAKGGTSASLGDRMVDGVRAQQGTARYLGEIARLDPRLRDALTSYLDSPGADPEIAAAIRSGTIEVRYDLVQARPDPADGAAQVRVTRFDIDQTDPALTTVTPADHPPHPR